MRGCEGARVSEGAKASERASEHGRIRILCSEARFLRPDHRWLYWGIGVFTFSCWMENASSSRLRSWGSPARGSLTHNFVPGARAQTHTHNPTQSHTIPQVSRRGAVGGEVVCPSVRVRYAATAWPCRQPNPHGRAGEASSVLM